MNLRFNIYLVFVFVFLTSNISFGQVTADFTAAPVQGCAPLVVNFTNNSTGSGTLTYFWYFGNGNTSGSANPGANYINPGVYTVTLIVTNGTSSDTLVRPNYITVFQNPVAGFEGIAPLSGCIPLNINFNDSSVEGDGAINQWQWDFGDGNSSTSQNPSHLFTTVGIYDISLQVTDVNGCTDNMTLQNYVTASTKPTVAFSANATNNCTVPFTVQFTNTSAGFGTLTYDWDFGDGGTSTGISPSHTYTVADTFTVSLVATDQYGCSDSLILTDYISITPVQAAFHSVPGDSACPNFPVQFFNDAGTTNAIWDFGDGSPVIYSTTTSVTHSFTTPGTWTVTMTAAPTTPCESVITGTIVIRQPPVTSFTPSPSYYCGNDPIVFTDNSPNAVNWTWTSNPVGFSSTAQNPSATFSDEGSYIITLIIQDSYGCLGIHTDTVVVDFPNASISWDSDSLPNHCIPFPVDFTGSGLCTVDSIPVFGGYSWNFGDPALTSDTSTLQNPTYVYDSAGVYTITLTVTTATGCTATATTSINIGSHQVPIISDTTFIGCANDSNVHFISLSTDSTLIDFWDWTFIANFPDSNFTVASSSEQHPTVDFDGLDSITIQLIVGYLECKDTIYDTNAFFLDGPFIQGMDTVFSCETPFHLGLTFASIKKATRYYWDFDNNGTYDDSTIYSDPMYIYNDTAWYDFPGRGIYTVHLTAFNDSSAFGCKYEDSLTFRLLDIHADITAPSPNCINNNLFNISGSYDWFSVPNDTIIYSDMDIDYGDGQTIHYGTYSSVISHNFPPVSASYWVELAMENYLGCSDTDSVFIRIFQPVAGFTMSPDSGCAPLTITLIDTSYADTTYTSSWLTGGFGTASGDTGYITFNNTGIYYPYLKVTDAIGCTSIAPTMVVYVIDLQPSLSVLDSTICLGDSVSFTSQATNVDSLIWNFGDGTGISNNANPSYLFTDTGNYNVQLHIQSTLPGCVDDLQQNISVQSMDVLFTVADADSNCYPFPVTITNSTSTVYNPAWNWNFGDGGVGIQQTPFHNYTMPGNFWLSLLATTSNGCTDKDSLLISITGPYAQITVNPNIICKGDTVTFALENPSGISTVSWDFGDGGISNDTSSVITHIYNTVPPIGGYGPSLIYCSSPNCCLPNSSDSVYVRQVMAIFNYTQAVTGDTITGACQPGSIDFHNTSLGPDISTWYFGDGQNYSGFEPTTHTYYDTLNTPVTYNITLIVENNSAGCIDSITHPFTVYPEPRLYLSKDTAICLNSSAYLSATGDGTIISWTPSDGLSNTNLFNTLASPDSTTMYYAFVMDNQGCTNNDSVNVAIQQIPSLFITVPYPKPYPDYDTTIIIGEFVNIQAFSDQDNVSFVWTPPVWLSCVDCQNPVAQPLHDTTYTVIISDSMNCFDITTNVRIKVREEYSIDVPTAFTPDGNGDNDIVYVKGWGILNLLEFKIYNRWGECIFSTDDLHHGWDGTFKGIKQNIDTYAYTAKAVTWGGKTLTKNGLINLLR